MKLVGLGMKLVLSMLILQLFFLTGFYQDQTKNNLSGSLRFFELLAVSAKLGNSISFRFNLYMELLQAVTLYCKINKYLKIILAVCYQYVLRVKKTKIPESCNMVGFNPKFQTF
ncbi:hypothetical protein VNO77_04783 [Canavalia gladiata]|uniref:Uncharacterized protein n=1 Tax=Canavalia gladiata TaxID=3824 RepID=A0AAN9N2T8_CANGL